MSFPVECPNCQTKLKAQDKHVGKKLSCPKCKQPFVVTAPAPPENEPIVELTEAAPSNPLLDGDLANLDLGELGTGRDNFGDVGSNAPLGDLGTSAAGPANSDPFDVAGGSLAPSNLAASNPYLQQAQQPTTPVADKPAAAGVSPQFIGLIVAGGVGGLVLLIGLVVVGIWLFRPSSKPADKPVAEASPTTNLSSTAGSAAPTPDSSASAVDPSPAAPVSNKPPGFDWEAIVAAESQGGKRRVFGSLSSSDADESSILIASTDKKRFEQGKFALDEARDHKLPAGHGLPLAARPAGWFTGEATLRVMMYESKNRQTERMVPVSRVEVVTPDDTKLIQSKVDGEGYTITRLTPFGSPSSARLREAEKNGGLILRSDHRHLWSPDGNYLYVLVGTEDKASDDTWSNQILKVNSRNWAVELSFSIKLPSYSGQGGRDVNWRQQMRLYDFAWSSQGLVVVADRKLKKPMGLDAEGRVWFPMMNSTAHAGSLIVLDPETLKFKQGWSLPTLTEIGGSVHTPLVYLQYLESYVCVIDVESGELVNAIYHDATMRRPTVASDGKSLLTQCAGVLSRFQLSGKDVVFEQFRPGVGNQDFNVSADGQFVALHGRDKYYAVQSDDLNKSVGTAEGDDIGQWALDPVHKTAFMCSVDPKDRKLHLKILQDNAALQITLDAPADEAKPSTSSTRAAFAAGDSKPAPPLNEALWPIAMSAEPTGRGAIIFVENAAYWVETHTKGKAWAFDAEEQSTASVANVLKDTSADVARMTLPAVPNPPPNFVAIKDDGPGRLFQLPAGHFIRSFDVDPQSGNIAVLSVGGTPERNGTWLSVCRDADLASDNITPTALLFEGNAPVSFRYKRFKDWSLLLVARDDVVWVLDPRTFQPADTGGELVERIDLKSLDYEQWKPKQYDRKRADKPGTVSTVYVSSDSDDDTFVLGRGTMDSSQSYHHGYRISLKSGEITETTNAPTPRLSAAPSIGHIYAVPDPAGLLTVNRDGVTRDRSKLPWPDRVPDRDLLCVLEKRPWIVARGMKSVRFYNRDVLSDQLEVEFPELMQTPSTVNAGIPQTFADDDTKHDRLIFGTNPIVHDTDRARWGLFWVLPLGEAKLPDRALLVAQVEMPDGLEPGKPISLPVHVPDSRTKVVIVDGPKGAKLNGDKLEWTPTLADFGRHDLVLRASSGKQQTDHKIPYTVKFREVQLPFDEAGGIEMSASGEQLLVWQNYIRKGNDGYDDPMIALVNVRDRSVVATRRLKRGITRALIAPGGAYLLSQDGFVLEVCGLEDLEPLETFHLTDFIHDIVLLEDRFLFLKTQKTALMSDQLGPFHAFELPGLKQTQLTEILSGAPSFTRVSQTTDGWLVGPAVLDDRLKSIKSLHSLSWSGLGYISSTEFAGVSNDLGTQVVMRKPLPPPTGRSRNKDVSTPVGDDSVILTAKTVELNREAANRQPVVQLNASFTSAAAGWKPIEIPMGIYTQRYEEKQVFSRGKGVAMVADRKLYTFFPEDFGVKLPAPAKLSGMTLRARKPASTLSDRKSTAVPFVVEGGKPPYEYKVAMDLRSLQQFGRSRTPQEELIKVDTKRGVVTIEGQTLAETLLAGPQFYTIPLSEYAMRHDPTGTPEKVVAAYIQEVSNRLQPALGAPVRDYPVGVPIVVTVTDANQQEVSLRHELVLELPRQKIIDSINSELTQDGDREPKSPPDQLGIANPAQPRSLHVPAPELPLIWNDGTQLDVANELRRLWPRVAIDDPKWSVERLAAYSVVMASERLIAEIRDPRQGNELPARAWRTTDGKEVKGRLVGADERVVSVREEGQNHVQRLPLPLLDDESLEHAWIGVQRLRKVPEYQVRRGTASGGRRTTVQPHAVAGGVNGFAAHYGCLPPRAIVDDTGKPLLSWRVTLLPYLGYHKLFHLFQLDEPWDSEHNRKLIPYMPMIYNSTQAGLPLGRTTFKALSGPGTAFPDVGLRRRYDFEGNPLNALLVVEVDKSAAVEWTKPEDLERTEDQAWKDQLYNVQVEGNDCSHGIFGDGVLWIFRISDEQE